MTAMKLKNSHFKAPTEEVLREFTLGDLLDDLEQNAADKESLIEIMLDGQIGRRWTYGELIAQSRKLATALASRFSKGEKIAVWAPNIPEWVITQNACGLAGLVLVTVNPAYQTSELRYVLEQSGASALFMIDSFRGNPMKKIAAEALVGLDHVREVTNMQDEGQMYAGADATRKMPDIVSRDPMQIQYTSGTTGFPKGAVLTHLGILNTSKLYPERADELEELVWPNMLPMFHTSGCGLVTLGVMQKAGTIVLLPIVDPVLIMDLTEQLGFTCIPAVPTVMVALLQEQRARPRDISSIRAAISGGAQVAPELVRDVRESFDCRFTTIYGMTECSPTITMHFPTDSDEDISNSVGVPIPHIEVSIQALDGSGPVPVGEIGEICSRGYNTMLCYNDNPDATAKTIDTDGWLHTGDLGSLDARGYLYVTGRLKNMIIRGGENIYPAEIENCLLTHESVGQVAVVGLPDPQWGEVVAAFVQPEPEHALVPDKLHAHCRAQLAPQKTPTLWFEVDQYPMTGSGKIQKFALRDAYENGAFTPK